MCVCLAMVCLVDVRAHAWMAINAFAATSAGCMGCSHTMHLTLPEPYHPPPFAARWDNINKVCCTSGKCLYGLRSRLRAPPRAPPIVCPCSEALLARGNLSAMRAQQLRHLAWPPPFQIVSHPGDRLPLHCSSVRNQGRQCVLPIGHPMPNCAGTEERRVLCNR